METPDGNGSLEEGNGGKVGEGKPDESGDGEDINGRDGMWSSNGDKGGWTSSIVAFVVVIIGEATGVGKDKGTDGGRCRAVMLPFAVIGRAAAPPLMAAAAPVARPNVAGAPVAVVGRCARWALLGVGGALWVRCEPWPG